jgi:hypothetical protein
MGEPGCAKAAEFRICKRVYKQRVDRFYFIRFMQNHKDENADIEAFLNKLVETYQKEDGVK